MLILSIFTRDNIWGNICPSSFYFIHGGLHLLPRVYPRLVLRADCNHVEKKPLPRNEKRLLEANDKLAKKSRLHSAAGLAVPGLV